MGLGLSICRSIVEAHGGVLTIDDTLREGSCVTFTLQRLDGKAEAMPAPSAMAEER